MHVISRNRAIFAAAVLALGGAGLWVSTTSAQDFVGNAEATTKACFRADRVDGFASVKFSEGVDGINLRHGKDVYQAKFATPCPEIRESTKVAIDSKVPGGYVCNGSDADIVTYSVVSRPQRCKIIGLRKVEAAEVASLPAKERP